MKFRILFLVGLLCAAISATAQENFLTAANITADNAAEVALVTELTSDIEWADTLAVEISAQERYLVIWGFDATTDVIEVWDLSLGEPTTVIRPDGIVLEMTFADSDTVAVIIDSEIIFYDVSAGDEEGRMAFDGAISNLQYSPDASDFFVFVEGDEGLMLNVIATADDEEAGVTSSDVLVSVPAPDMAVYSAATTIYMATEVDGMTRFDRLDIASGDVTEGMVEYEAGVDMLASRQMGDAQLAVADGVMLTTLTPNNLGEDSGYMLDYEGEVESSVTALTYSPDGSLLYVAFGEDLHILDAETGESLHIVDSDAFEVMMSLDAGNKVIVGTGENRTVIFQVASE